MFGKKEAKKIPRFRVGKGNPGLKAALFKLTSKPYLDIRIYRGYRQITRIVTPDKGMDTFTIDDIGTFVVPKGDELMTQYHDRNALYLCYNLANSKAGIPVESEKPTKFEFPALSPEEFQRYLESQTVADLLSETKKDTSWLWYLIIAAIVIFALLMIFGGF